MENELTVTPVNNHNRTTLLFWGILYIAILIMGDSIQATDKNTILSAASDNDTPSYTIQTFDPNVGADVTQNPEINANIPRTNLTNQIFEYQKRGSVILQFGRENGIKLLIWAGIHGNEAEANIATVRYLEYIKDKSLKGTLFVIPFAIPKDTALNSRSIYPVPYYSNWVPAKKGWYKKWYKKLYRKKIKHKWKSYYDWTYKWKYNWNSRRLYKPLIKMDYTKEDPNRIANIPGTPGWNVVEFAKNNGIEYILDVHSGGDLTRHPNGLIYADHSYEIESLWANYISSHTGSFVEYNDKQSGKVRNQGHNYGINTITLEVERDAGSTSDYAEVELKMIKAACEFFGFPGL